MLTGEIKCQLAHIGIFPASHYVVPAEQIQKAAIAIEEELKERVDYFKSEDKLLEAQRISERTNFDIEMMKDHPSYRSSGSEGGGAPCRGTDRRPDF